MHGCMAIAVAAALRSMRCALLLRCTECAQRILLAPATCMMYYR
jgi:hypothetical protein